MTGPNDAALVAERDALRNQVAELQFQLRDESKAREAAQRMARHYRTLYERLVDSSEIREEDDR